MTDYLWDKHGPRDPDIVELERLLAPYGQQRPAPPLQLLAAPPRRLSPASIPILFAAAAAVIALVAVVWRVPTGPVLSVTTTAGTPTIGARAIADRGDLPVGDWLETDASARATVEIGDIGRVDVEPHTRLGVRSTRPGDFRLHLDRGTLHAVIWAPPGRFVVDTASATAVDLGCAYTLTIDDAGVGEVRVTSGWVGFEGKGRESFIPAGAVGMTRPGLGPGTPYFDDVSPEFRQAIDLIDTRTGTAEMRAGALDRILTQARQNDAVTLWHLLTRVDTTERERVFDRLAQLVAPPAGVTRAGVVSGDRAMLDRWWNEFGLGTATWWRTWRQHWRDDRPSK